MKHRALIVGMLVACVLLTACGRPTIPDVEGQDLPFARGALSAADLEYKVEDTDVSSRDQDGIIQSAYYDDDGVVILEVGRLPRITIVGTFTLRERTSTNEGRSCSGSGGYSDFGSGMNVTIRDGDGNIIGSTNTDAATYREPAALAGRFYCQTGFEVEVDITDFYEVTIGRRGSLTYSYNELEARDFRAELTLGG